MAESKPTAEAILENYTDLKDKVYGPVKELFVQDEAFYELDFADNLELPEEFKDDGIVLPTARDMVDSFVDHIDIANARVFVNKKGSSQVSAEEAEMMRKFYLGIINRTNVEASISPWRVAAKHYALHGATFIKTLWDTDIYGSKPATLDEPALETWRKDNVHKLPIIIKAVHPGSILTDPDHIEPEYFYEYHEKQAFSIKKKFPRWSNPKDRKPSETIDWVEYWDKEYRCYFADGEPLFGAGGGVIRHGYGFLPITEILSGLGNVSIENKLTHRYVGILRYMFDILVAESRNYSMSDIILKKAAWPWYTAEGENANQLAKIDQYFGAVTQVPPGVELKKQTPDVPPEALRQQYAITNDIISAHAAPRAVRGLSETGVRSGSDRRQMIAEAASRYQYSKESFSNGTAKVLMNCARLFKSHEDAPGMRVWTKTSTDEFDEIIDQKKMREPFTCYVEFEPVSEEDEYRRHDDLIRLKNAGIITNQFARSQMSNVDPVAMERQEMKELLRQSPAYQEMVNEYIRVKSQEAIRIRLAADSPASPPQPAGASPVGAPMPVQTGAPPQELVGGMVPTVPNIAAPGSAQDLQTQMKNMRSQIPMSATQGQGGGGARYA